jgi:hypothetical protein
MRPSAREPGGNAGGAVAGNLCEPEVIKRYILEIRKVLGDRPGKPLFIETAPKRGYRFIAAVSEGGSPDRTEETPESAKSMVGREAALIALDRYLDQACKGFSQVIFVTGDAGIGKTTLVDAFYKRAVRDPDWRVALALLLETSSPSRRSVPPRAVSLTRLNFFARNLSIDLRLSGRRDFRSFRMAPYLRATSLDIRYFVTPSTARFRTPNGPGCTGKSASGSRHSVQPAGRRQRRR